MGYDGFGRLKEGNQMTTDPNNDVSFAETALRLGGKTEEEATKTGAVDRADDQVESMFAEQYKTVNSPIHRAVWDDNIPIDLFTTPKSEGLDLSIPAMKKCLEVLQKHQKANTVWDAKGKVSDQILQELAEAGYWGMLIPKKYGGQGATVRQFMSFLSEVATIDPTSA